jgi:hypothetical protein
MRGASGELLHLSNLFAWSEKPVTFPIVAHVLPQRFP